MSRPLEPHLPRRDRLVCAYIAMSYVLDRRTALAVSAIHPGPLTQALATGLSQADRRSRAVALASALEPILKGLERRRCG